MHGNCWATLPASIRRGLEWRITRKPIYGAVGCHSARLEYADPADRSNLIDNAQVDESHHRYGGHYQDRGGDGNLS